jgi:hypothetical protein
MTAPGSYAKIAFGDELLTIADNSSSGFGPRRALEEGSDVYRRKP